MAVTVDTIETLLVANVAKHNADYKSATAAAREYLETVRGGAANDVAIEQSAAKQTSAAKDTAETRKRVAKEAADAETAAAKASADAAKAAAKERSDAAKAAAKVEADAARESQRLAKETAEAERQLAVASRNATRSQIEDLERLKAAEREASNQAKANAFLTGSGNRAGIQRSEVQSAFGGQLSRLEAEQVARETSTVARPPINLFSDYDARQSGASGSGSKIGGVSDTGDRSTAARQTEIMAATRVQAEGVVAAQKEVDALARDEVITRALLVNAVGAEKDELKETRLEYQIIRGLQRAGLSDTAVAIELEETLLKVKTQQAERDAASAAAQGRNNLLRFGEAAGIGRTGGGAAAIGGLVAAAGAGIAVEAVKSATDYARALTDVSKQAGITAEALQVYQHAAVDAGAKSTDFDQGLRELSANLGRARTGSEEQAKVFAALGVDIKGAASAGDLLPTLIDRISSITDQSKRARVEVALFGESGEKLDGLLSGGNQKVNELAAALERTGSVLSSDDIAKLDDVAKKLDQVKAQLSVDIAQTVAGNADAIEHLADSFAKLVDNIGKAITAYEKFSNSPVGKGLSVINSAAGIFNPLNAAGSLIGRLGGSNTGAVATQVGQTGNSVSLSLGDDVQKGGVNNSLLSKIGAPKGPKGPKGKSADQLASEQAARDKAYTDELGRLQDAELQAHAEITGNIQRRAKIEDELAKNALARQLSDIEDERKRNVARGENPTEARNRANTLAQAAKDAEQARSDAREQQVAAEQARADDQSAATLIGIRNSDLNNQLAIADTTKQRLEIELKLLANAKELERNRLNTIIASNPSDSPAVADAKKQLGNLDANFAGQEVGVRRQNETPGQQYARSLKSTSDTVESGEVKALEAFNDGLDKSVSKALHLHGIFGDIVNDLIDMAIKQALIKPLADGFFGGSGGTSSGGGLGGILGSIGKLFGGGGSGGFDLSGNTASASAGLLAQIGSFLPAFANGGSINIGGNGGVDNNLLSLNGKPVARVNQGERLDVIPRGQIASRGGAMSLQQTINIDGRNSVTPTEFAGQILNIAADHANRAASQAGASALKAAPARVQQVNNLGNQ